MRIETFPPHTLVTAVSLPHRLRSPIEGLSVFTALPTQMRNHLFTHRSASDPQACWSVRTGMSLKREDGDRNKI
jgi:hypothetical protein